MGVNIYMGRAFFLSCEIWRSANKVSEIIREISKKVDADTLEIAPFSDGIDDIGIIVNCHPEGNMRDGCEKHCRFDKSYW